MIRHAQSQGNASGNYSTDQADSLSVLGLQQAEELARSLASHTFDHIITSPLRRTLQTIAPYVMSTQQKAEIWPELAEACWHDEREPMDTNWHTRPARIPQELANLFYFRDGNQIQPGFPESFATGLFRVHLAQKRLERLSATYDTVLMVAHGHLIREMLNMMLQISPIQMFPHDNCGMTSISYSGRWKLDFVNRAPVALA
jgi:broad specificity phosphatase PhoE